MYNANLLMIGGPYDGHRIELDDIRLDRHVSVPYIPPQEADDLSVGLIEKHDYIVTMICESDGTRRYCLKHSSIDDDQLVKRLVDLGHDMDV